VASPLAGRYVYLLAYFIIAALFFISYQPNAFAELPSKPNSLFEFLVQEKSSQHLAINELKNVQPPNNLADYNKQLKTVDALIAVNDLKLANFDSILYEQQNDKQRLLFRLKKLQQANIKQTKEHFAHENIIKINELLGVNEKIIELINDNISLAQQVNSALISQRNNLKLWNSKHELDKQVVEINKNINALKLAQSKLYQTNINLQESKQLDYKSEAGVSYEAQLMLNNQKAILINTQISELNQLKREQRAQYIYDKNNDLASLEALIKTYKTALSLYTTMRNNLLTMQALISNRDLMLIKPALKVAYKQFSVALLGRIEVLTERIDSLNIKIERAQTKLKSQLSARQSLAEYHFSSWPAIGSELIMIPVKFYGYLKELAYKIGDNYSWKTTWPAVLYWLSLAFILVVAFVLNGFIGELTQDKTRLRLSGHLYDWALLLIKRNIPQLTFIILLISTFYFNNISINNSRLIFKLFIVWIAFRNIILVARIALLESVSDSSGNDVKLYYRLKHLLQAGGWVTALMVFSHLFPLSLLMQDIFNRLFMLFLLAVALVIWRSKDVIPHVLRPVLKAKKRYVRKAVILVLKLFPITLLTTALVGLVGYINLAWTMSWYQIYFLMVLTGYVLVQGLLVDLLELISEWMISSLHNGWLWIEVILKPIDKILRLVLLLFSVVVLFQLYGWYSDSWVMTNIKVIGTYPIINISGIHITIYSSIKFVILLFILLWASKWTREFGYRWLYRKSRDVGIRNSLSAFTQYGVILVGTFITLRVLGIDFSGMSMILGGLAVGMGFGLRDFASNIIGGVMLLIERPVREGDLITLGDYEGRVAHIGIRSMRVSSWDNMEVLIPNAETFNKPFTNWTHQDNVVRSVIPIKVSRSDDPVFIQQLILDVLAIIPEIIDTPPPQVFLKHIDEALIEFEVRYYINVLENTRFAVRSKVLFAITAQFKAAGVKPPIPPMSIEFTDSSHATIKPTEQRD